MRKIREILRLKNECLLSNAKIAQSCQISRETVRKYLIRVNKVKLNWPVPAGLDDEKLEQLLFPSEWHTKKITAADLQRVHQELKKPGVTRWLLWEEHRASCPDGPNYSQFCEIYRQFAKTLEPEMRQTHKAGEKLFVDYAGMTLPWVDQATGEIFKAEIFVAVLGASNYTYVEATKSQSLPDWIGSHVRCFRFLGGLPHIVVCDNLRSGVTSAHRYEPEINFTYQDMADHYGIAVIPAGAASPKHKAKVEVGVQGIERRILARLRDRTFFSVAEINVAIRPLLEEYNQRPFQKIPGCRTSEFNLVDRPALKLLPEHAYEYAEWRKARAGIDYHVAFEHHYYSVPHPYIKHELCLRITRTLIQCFYKNKLIAAHVRSYSKGHTTVKEHMPKSHRAYAEWTPERLLRWAKQSGSQTEALINALISARRVPQQAFRACLGILRLGKSYGTERLEKACQRALKLGAISYKSVESILKHGLEEAALMPEQSVGPITHENLRGSDYYSSLQ